MIDSAFTSSTSDVSGTTATRAGSHLSRRSTDRQVLDRGAFSTIIDDHNTAHDVTSTVESGRQQAEPDRASTKLRTTTHCYKLISAELIAQALDIAGDLSVDAPEEFRSVITSLRGVVSDMWVDAVDASQHHQDILAILDIGLETAADMGTLDEDQAQYVRMALNELGMPHLVNENVDSLRNYFLDVGLGPLLDDDEWEGEC